MLADHMPGTQDYSRMSLEGLRAALHILSEVNKAFLSVYIYANKEAGLAQEIQVTFFEHLLLYNIPVATGHWTSTTSAAALGVDSPSAITPLSQTICTTIFSAVS